MGKKRGNLRVRKGSAVYGPMTREDVLKLRDAGRFSDADEISADDGEWIALPKYLAESADRPVPPPAPPQKEQPSSVWKTTTPAVSRRERDAEACLRVLKDGKVYPPMTRKQVTDLRAAQRLTDESLISATDGPWMRLADFFAPPAPEPPPRLSASGRVILEEVVEDELEEVVDVEDVSVEVVEDSTELAPLSEADSFHKAAPMRVPLSDKWFVKIRGTHSLPLKGQHIKELLMAREAHAETPTRHVSWPEQQWMPLKDNPDLCHVLK